MKLDINIVPPDTAQADALRQKIEASKAQIQELTRKIREAKEPGAAQQVGVTSRKVGFQGLEKMLLALRETILEQAERYRRQGELILGRRNNKNPDS